MPVLVLFFLSLLSGCAEPRTPEQNNNYVYRIEIGKGGFATGFRLNTSAGKPIIISNWHVCDNYPTASLSIIEGGARKRLTPIKWRASRDLCALVFKTEDASGGLTLAADDLDRFRLVYTIGYPGSRLHYSEGLTLDVERMRVPYPAPQKGCPRAFGTEYVTTQYGIFLACVADWTLRNSTLYGIPGSSGSPVFNGEGHVIGVVNVSDGRHASYIQYKDLIEFWGKL